MHKKKIQQVEVGLNEKKKIIITIRTFLFFYWKRIAEDDFCSFLFFKYYSKFPLNSYMIICISEFRKNKVKKKESANHTYGHHMFCRRSLLFFIYFLLEGQR